MCIYSSVFPVGGATLWGAGTGGHDSGLKVAADSKVKNQMGMYLESQGNIKHTLYYNPIELTNKITGFNEIAKRSINPVK